MEVKDRGDALLEETWERLVALAKHADEAFKIRERYQKIRQLAIEYPLITVCIVAFLAACSVPLMCFITFAAVSTVITFCGFLFIEGILLTIGTLILGGTLMIIVAVTLGFITSLIFASAVFIGTKHMWKSCSKSVKTWINQFRYQCWEHASYKEVWQSDRTSEPEVLQSDIGAKFADRPKEKNMHNTPKTE